MGIKHTIRRLIASFPENIRHSVHLPNHYHIVDMVKTGKDEMVLDRISGNGSLMWYFRNSAIGRSLFYNGYFENDEIVILKRFVKKLDTVIDIGANIGYHTIMLSDLVGAGGEVYSVEPYSKNYEILKKNIILNKLRNVYADKLCIGEKDGEIGIRIYDDYAFNSILNINRIKKLDIKEKTRMLTLDKFVDDRNIRKLDFIKMDVEGYEYMILKGAEKTLSKYKPLILCEIYDENIRPLNISVSDVIGILLKYKYSCFGIYPRAKLIPEKLKRSYTTYNFLFIPENQYRQ